MGGVGGGGAVNWSTEKPTEPGWYWVWFAGVRPHIVQVVLIGGRLMIWTDGAGIDLANYRFWCGPLPCPEPPRVA